MSTSNPPSQPSYPQSKPSSDSLAAQGKAEKKRRDRKDRPCDACRRRKSKCVINDGQTVCAACAMHNQQCTYVEDPRPRKRRQEGEGLSQDGVKRRIAQPDGSKGSKTSPKIKREDLEGSPPTSTSPGSWHYYGSHVGYTTELEPMLFDISRSSGPSPWSANYQKSDDRNAFLTFGDNDAASSPQVAALLAVEKLVGPNAPPLLQHFQATISRSFPIIEPSTLAPAQRKNLDPALLCAIYTVSGSSPGFTSDKKRLLDIQQLEDLALNLIHESFNKPTLSTIQAGLLLMQRSDIDSKTLNTQLVSAIFELGLHLDCSNWQLSEDERGLRKRLAWAIYMQDVWCSLVHGRPSMISKAHWAVRDLEEEDFRLEEEVEAVLEERERGHECFCQMVTLTQILSNILDTFYTQKAMQDYDDAGENGTRLILERAKPIQMRLKEWFTELPKTLKLENGQAPSIIGHLHLAYFATEITLHRCIIRSLSTPTPSPSNSSASPQPRPQPPHLGPPPHNPLPIPSADDNYLTFICRGAAKSRLISAMDFVNRLRSDHLLSFWYFPSKVNFALVATFGSLLLATAPCQEEVEFYAARLREYRWTLTVSAKNAGFLNFAIESLESSSDLLKSLPPKPKIEDLDLRQMPTPQLPIPYLIPQQDRSAGEGEDDEDMLDAPIVEPIHSSAFQSHNFLGTGSGTNNTSAANYSGWGGAENMSPVTEDNEAPFFFQSNNPGFGPRGDVDMVGGMWGAGGFGAGVGGGGAGGGAGGLLVAGFGEGGWGADGKWNEGGSKRGSAAVVNGPFAGTAFEGLGARNWFDNSHHGSPEGDVGMGY